MASPMETIKAGLGKVKAVNKSAKNRFLDSGKGENFFQEYGNKEPANVTGRDIRAAGRYVNQGENTNPSTKKLATPKGILPAIGAASSIADAASEIDNIRKGKSDILERTGIYKRPKEL